MEKQEPEFKQFGDTNYSVNEFGYFMDCETEKHLPFLKDRYNNKVVALLVDGKVIIQRVDKAVAYTFIENPEGLTAVTHKNHKKYDCSVGNLEWFDNSVYDKKGYI